MNQKLIYDVGANDGIDSAYYLKKGFRVVAIEASPIMAGKLKEKFASEIASGAYMLLEVGIAERKGEADFWICDSHSDWSSFDRDVASREGAEHHRVTVKTRPFAEILDEYGTPFYCKVDIEGHDRFCLLGMTATKKPRYVSVEMSHEDGDVDLRLLKDLGYTKFKLISQVTRAQPSRYLMGISVRKPVRPFVRLFERRLRGVRRDGDWVFPFGSSGSFAEKTPGAWKDHSHVCRLWQRRHDLTTGRSTLDDWFDIHATF